MTLNIKRLYSWIPNAQKEYPARSTQSAIDYIAEMMLYKEKPQIILDTYRYYIKHSDHPDKLIDKISRLISYNHDEEFEDFEKIALMYVLLREDDMAEALIKLPHMSLSTKAIKKHIDWVVNQMTLEERKKWENAFDYAYIDSVKMTQHFEWFGKVNIPKIQKEYIQFSLRPAVIHRLYKESIRTDIVRLYQLDKENARDFITQSIRKMSTDLLQNAFESDYLISGDEALIELFLASINMQELPDEKKHSIYRTYKATDESNLCNPSLLFANMIAAPKNVFLQYKDIVITALTPMCEDILFMQDFFLIDPERVLICMQHDTMLMSYIGLIYEELFSLEEDLNKEQCAWLQSVFKWDDAFFDQEPNKMFQEISTKLWNTCQPDKDIALLHQTIDQYKIQSALGVVENIASIYQEIKNSKSIVEIELFQGVSNVG